jgi:putative tricarboxylic transport membrane protein
VNEVKALLEYILLGFANLLNLELIILVILGLAGGIIIGALPGFSPTMGVALLVPFTFFMSPIEGLSVLGAVYAGAVYGGSISAVLINIPGAPANVATLFDGYPMAQKGEGRKALLASLIASVNGGLMSAVALLVIAPLLAVIALKFGPPEKFWMAVFGLVIIASLGTGRELIKGLFSGAFGVWLGIIGVSSITGEPRFVFGLPELWGGISVVPALVGLFAFSQVLVYFERNMMKRSGSVEVIEVKKEKGDIWALVKEIFTKHRKLTLYTGALGTMIGIIPGAGGQVGGVVAYDQAKRFSKKSDQFGTGVVEGVIAPETANNATVGGSIIPLLTLGIPGSPTAAVLLGGLLIHGLWPGPLLFIDNAAITYTFMVAFLFAQLAMFFVALPILTQAVHIVRVSDYYLGPAVIALCIFGAFAVNNHFFDVYVMIVLGVIGYLFIKAGISLAPAILGLVLGPIAELNFMLALRVGTAKGDLIGYLFTRPITVVILLLIVAVLVSTVLMEINRYRKMRGTAANAILGKSEPAPRKITRGILSLDAIMGLVIFFASMLIWQFYLAGLSGETGLFPTTVFIIMGLIGLFQAVYGIFIYSDTVKGIPWRVVIEATAVTVTAVLAANTLGLFTVTFLLCSYVGIRLVSLSGDQVKAYVLKILAYNIVATAFLYVCFRVALRLPTPQGLFF